MTPNAKWYQAANEGAFKPVAEGYVFQTASPWVLARPRHYLVNDAQKAKITEVLGRWRLLLVAFMMMPALLTLTAVPLWPTTFSRLYQSAYQLGVVPFALLIMLMMVPFAAVPQIYLFRALRPLLAGAPRTNQRISMREQLSTMATVASSKLMAVVLVAGLVNMGGGIFTLLDDFVDGHLARHLYQSMFMLIFGGLLAAYAVHLLRLKAKLKRVAA